MKKFVYALVDDTERVFYIGCSKDILVRYKQHIGSAKKPLHAVSKFIRSMLDRGVYPDIAILYHLPENEATIKEAQTIMLFSNAGQPLTNSQFYTPRGRYSTSVDICKISNKKDVFDHIRYKQEKFIFFYDNKDENGNQISMEYPESPKLIKVA